MSGCDPEELRVLFGCDKEGVMGCVEGEQKSE